MARLFTTCPPSSAYDAPDYAARVAEVSRWSEAAGAEGTLVYTDNSLVDPWSVAQLILGATRRLTPLVAVQPVYTPPFTLAKTIASLAFLTGRKVALNLVAGGFVRDLAALGDATPHDERYGRLEEYATIVLSLLRGQAVSFEGRHYRLDGAVLSPALPAELLPDVMVSGSSEAGASVAAALGAIPVTYPQPPEQAAAEPLPVATGRAVGARVGIIARESRAEAWAIAHARFPADPRGRMQHALAMAKSDSAWHARLSSTARDAGAPEDGAVYWLHPFQTYKTFCPYLVGSHEEVADALAVYLERGVTDVILDVPMTQEDLPNTLEAVRLAASVRRAVGSCSARA